MQVNSTLARSVDDQTERSADMVRSADTARATDTDKDNDVEAAENAHRQAQESGIGVTLNQLA